MEELVKISDLNVRFYTYEGVVQAVDHINLDINHQETLGLVGETGCGKTVTALSLLRLVSAPGKIESGSILFNPDHNTPIDLLSLSEAKYRELRGSMISMIFQEPSAALNPVFTIGEQISEVIILHRWSELIEAAIKTLENKINYNSGLVRIIYNPILQLQKTVLLSIHRNHQSFLRKFIERIPLVRRLLRQINIEAEKMSVQALREVDIPDPARIFKQHPHQLSGGMKQRAVIAMALACNPKLLIADEPTTSLDVTIQVQILQLLRKLKEERQSSILYITHDLAVAAELCDRIGVMYAGSLCEVAGVKEIFGDARHPYTHALLDAVPRPGVEPKAISGFLPDPINLPQGCKFHTRCDMATEKCKTEVPALNEVAPGHFVACHNEYHFTTCDNQQGN